jgi:hypothetical protein
MQGWSATVTQSGTAVTARSVQFNGALGTGQSALFGFNASWSGSNPVPTSFALNGTTCTGSTQPTTTPTPTPTPTPTHEHTPTPTPTPLPSQPVDNPAWGKTLPPAGATLSHAYEMIQTAQASGYQPRSGECSVEVHARYSTYGPDGKVYPTWHPTKDPSGCAFGHEHGDDPRTSDLFGTVGWPAFGYTSEVLAQTAAASGQRHEDHVGHKVLAVNNSNVVQGDNGTSFFPPSGSTAAVCDVLLKFHQGTHSPDAFTNNLHELIFASSCTQDGQTVEARYSALIPVGRPGGFSSTDCPGPNLGQRFTQVGPAVPASSPSDTRSLGRLLTDASCVQAIRDGKTHFEVIENKEIPFDTNDLHEFWFSDVRLSTSAVSFTLSPLFYVLNPSRYYDPSAPNKLARVVDLCATGIRGAYCDQVRSYSSAVTWDDPRSPFKGTLREFRPGSFAVRTSGPTTVYTDALGANPSSTPFAGSIKQYFSGTSTGTLSVRGATRDYGGSASTGVHAPN